MSNNNEAAKELCKYAKNLIKTIEADVNYFSAELLGKTTAKERIDFKKGFKDILEVYAGLIFSPEGSCGLARHTSTKREELGCGSCNSKEHYYQMTENYRSVMKTLTDRLSKAE